MDPKQTKHTLYFNDILLSFSRELDSLAPSVMGVSIDAVPRLGLWGGLWWGDEGKRVDLTFN